MGILEDKVNQHLREENEKGIDFKDFVKNPIKYTIQSKHISKSLDKKLKKQFPREYKLYKN